MYSSYCNSILELKKNGPLLMMEQQINTSDNNNTNITLLHYRTPKKSLTLGKLTKLRGKY